MYWSRTGHFTDLVAWALMLSLFWLGGCMLASFVFRLPKREIPLVGMGTGFLLFILVSNLLAYFLPLTLAFWFSAAFIFIFGLLAGWRANFQPRFLVRELWGFWKQGLAFLLLMAVFSLIMRGLTIFDEYSNLPLVGTLARADFPPHFYLDSQVPLYYHYGLHLFAASLVRAGGLMVWSAFDLSRALTIVLTLLLSWLWLRRYTHSQYFLFLGSALILFASGSRWLLLFFSPTAQEKISASIQLQGSALETAPDLKTALVKPWNIESGSTVPFPFAFANGIVPPLSLAVGGSGAAPQLTLILLLLLSRRRWRVASSFLYGLILASLALIGEYLFLMVGLGAFLAVLIRQLGDRRTKANWNWAWVFIPSVLLVPVMGGVLTGIISGILARLAGESANNLTFTGISLRWPPSFTSSHLGNLSLFDPNQLFVALVEIGPLLLLAPWSIWIIVTSIRTNKLVTAGLAIGAWIGFAAPLFFQLSFSDRDVSRIIGISFFVWLVISLPWIRVFLRKHNHRWEVVFGILCAVTIFSGLALFPSQWIAIQRTNYSYFIDEPDTRMSRLHWNDLQADALVLDLSLPSRPGTIFGLGIGHAFRNIDTPFPAYGSLLQNPDPISAAQEGYSYIYMDRDSWQDLTGQQKQAYDRNCVRQVAEFRSVTNDFRRLYDIRRCAQ